MMFNKQEVRNMKKGMSLAWLSIPVVIIIIAIAILSFVTFVPAGHRGVLLTWGAVDDYVMQEGLNFRTPISQSVVIMEVRTQKFSSEESSVSSDLQLVTTEITVNYRLDGSRVNKVYQELSLDYEDRVILPAIKEAVKASTAKFDAEELINKRDLVKNEIESALKERVGQFGGALYDEEENLIERGGIIIQSISITNFEFSEQFDIAIEGKVTAEQEALKALNELEKIKIEAQQQIEMAKARAKSIEIEAQALKENPELVSLRWVEKWNGQLPTFMMGDSQGILLNMNVPT